jgi:plastocyanin
LVRRLLTPAAASFLLCLAAIAVAAAPAGAANRRVAISNYQWSLPEVEIDLGEHVTWYWTGPDTMHSVTGTSPNDLGLDSDPNSSVPHHDVGDSFKLSFSQPGTYAFQCKLHPFVRGAVVVSSTPGDPFTEPDPIPPNNIDLTPPRITDVHLVRKRFGVRRTALRLALDKRALVDAEIYRVQRGKPPRFAGWRAWKAHVGYNSLKFGDRSRHFRARPGHYRAVLTATDETNNTSRAKRLQFTIVARGSRHH